MYKIQSFFDCEHHTRLEVRPITVELLEFDVTTMAVCCVGGICPERLDITAGCRATFIHIDVMDCVDSTVDVPSILIER